MRCRRVIDCKYLVEVRLNRRPPPSSLGCARSVPRENTCCSELIFDRLVARLSRPRFRVAKESFLLRPTCRERLDQVGEHEVARLSARGYGFSLPLSAMPALSAFPQRSPPRLLTAAACGGLRSAADCRTRRAKGPSFFSRTVAHRRYSWRARDTRAFPEVQASA